MFGNNINGPFISYSPMMNTNTMMGMRGPSMIGMGTPQLINQAPRSGGLLSSLFSLGRNSNTGGLLSGGKSINFVNILNNTSKALGVVRDAIPIVKEVGPMMNNMKSMLKIASIFKDETDNNNTPKKIETTSEVISSNTDTNKKDTSITSTTTTQTNTNEPNFFL